ncbi:MAG TPA: enoyl-CoA hydratase-related protein [Polyangiaceae bacterium]
MMQAPESRPPRRSSRPHSERPEAGVRVEDTGRIRKVLLDRPSRKNAIDRAMYQTLTTALQEAAISERIDVVLIASSGGAFSAGSDPGEALASPGADGEAFAQAAGAFLRALASFPKPIVAAVGGVAVGLGATILLHCDLVVAAHTAAFEFPRVRLPVEPEAGSSVLLAARVGLQRASEWLLFGDRIDVDTALRFGLVNTIVQREELASAALARAEALARLPQSVVRETKRLLREPLRVAVEEAIARELEVISRSSPPPPVVASSL